MGLAHLYQLLLLIVPDGYRDNELYISLFDLFSSIYRPFGMKMQSTANYTLRWAVQNSATVRSPRISTTAPTVTRRHFTTSSATTEAFFLDTLRKNHTPPTLTHRINGPIGANVNISPSEELEKPTRFFRMIMFGKPGAGKGTLAQRLVDKYDLVSISTGDLLRRHISERTDLGREAENIVARGDLIPDKIMLKIVTHELDGLRDKVGLETTVVFGGCKWLIRSFPELDFGWFP